MTAQPANVEFLADLLKDAIRRIDLMADKVDVKLDSLERKMLDDQRMFKDMLEDRLDKVEAKIVDTNKTLQDTGHRVLKFEQSASILGWLLTSGAVASVWAFATWLGILKPPASH